MNEHSPSEQLSRNIAGVLELDGSSSANRRRWLVWGGSGAAVIALALVVFLLTRPEPVAYELGKVERGDVVVEVTATGTIHPLNQVDVGVEVSGTLERVLVDFNDRVTKGQVLAEINTDQLAARLDQSRATLLQSEARLAEARASAREAELRFDRSAELRAKGFASTQAHDTARATRDRARASVKSAEAQVVLSKAAVAADETSLSKATIRAPFDGVVLSRLIEPGQTVAATFQTPVLFKLAESLEHMELHVDIDEADIGQLRAGQPARFTVDAYPGRVFPATVTSVRNAPTTVQNVVTYPGVLGIENSDLALKPGMTATVDIEVARAIGVLTVPNGALRFTPEDSAEPETLPFGQGRVYVPDADNQPKEMLVETGVSDGTRTQIRTDLLSEGAEVIIDIARETLNEATLP